MSETMSVLELREEGKPNLQLLQEELRQACEYAGDQIEEIEEGDNTRFARWSDQQDTGRKGPGAGVKPWPEASDVRVHLVDGIVVDQVTVMKAAARRGQLTVRGMENTDARQAGKVELYLKYLRNNRLRAMIAQESEIAANWRQTHGRAVMAITWAQEWARDWQVVTVEQLMAAAVQDAGSPAALILAALQEPDRDVRAGLADLLQQLYPDMERPDAQKQLRALAETGKMQAPVRYLRRNDPAWTALKPWRDIFYPLNTEEAQDARWFAWRRVFTPEQVQEKALSEGWSDEFVAAVIKSVGSNAIDSIATDRAARGSRDSREAMDGLCEVFYFYYTQADDQGVPVKWRTVLSLHAANAGGEWVHGPDEPLDYEHGMYPFVFLRRERPDRLIEESRGVAKISGTSQLEVKYMRDARIDQTDLLLQPTMIRPERELGLPFKLRPRGEVGERRAGATRPFDFKFAAPAAEPLENAAIRDMDRYWARNRGEDPVRVALHEQTLADDWCEELQQCWAMTLQLAQQFVEQVQFSRVVGGKEVPFAVSREEIQGQYDLQLYFNTDALDPERMKAKMELMKNIIQPMDRWGVLNLAPVLEAAALHFFPEAAEQMVQSIAQASEKEISDEQANWALMIAGEEPTMVENGQNFQLRLQWLQNKLAQPAAQARLQAMPDSAEAVLRRMKHLQFMVQQAQNADTGRLGVPAKQEI